MARMLKGFFDNAGNVTDIGDFSDTDNQYTTTGVYAANQIVYNTSDTSFYRNITGTNTTTNPSSDTVNWEILSSGHIIENSSGTDLTNRSNLQFTGTGVAVTDDSSNDRTVVTINVGAGSGEVNTNSNAGTSSDGEGLVNTKVGANTPIKRIKAGTNISLTSETDDLVITSTASGQSRVVNNFSSSIQQVLISSLIRKTYLANEEATSFNFFPLLVQSSTTSYPNLYSFTANSDSTFKNIGASTNTDNIITVLEDGFYNITFPAYSTFIQLTGYTGTPRGRIRLAVKNGGTVTQKDPLFAFLSLISTSSIPTSVVQLSAGDQIGIALTFEPTLDMTFPSGGFVDDFIQNTGSITINKLTESDGRHIIENNSGTNLAQRVNLQFTGTGVQTTDDSSNDKTVVTIAAGETNTNSDATTPSTNEAGLVNTKFGVDTPIKIIKGGTGITVTENTNDVTIDNSSTGPAAFVKSTSINGTTSVSFVDQDDVTTTFTPATGGGSGSGVTFLSTQAQYDAQVWAAGDIFIPTDTGISIVVTLALPPTITFTITDPIDGNNLDLQVGFGIAAGEFFQSNNSNRSAFHVRKGATAAVTDPAIQFLTSSVMVFNPGTTITSATAAATALVTLINGISTSGTTIGSETITRNCVATSSGNNLILTSMAASSSANSAVGANGGGTVTIFMGQSASTFNFIENRIYIRRNANNGWLVYTTAIQDFIEA